MAVRRIAARRMLALALMAALLPAVLPSASAEAATAGEIRRQLQHKINNARQSRALRTLDVSEKMTDYARRHARDMADRQYIFHDSATELWNEVPAETCWQGENVGRVSDGRGAARRIHRAFMDSPGHRANILKARATTMGIGVVKANGSVWVVERFADRTGWPTCL